MKNKHAGSSFDSFLADEGIEADVAARAAKRTFVHELQKKMEKKHANKNTLRKALKSPSTTERLFNDHTGISLETMAKAATILNCDLEIRLVSKSKKRVA
jgi:antitoxin HicB